MTDNIVAPKHIVNWMIYSPEDFVPGERKVVLKFIEGVFSEQSKALEFKIDMQHNVLMADTSGFELKVCPMNKENTLHPDTLNGAGEILQIHGHKPLLMLIYLKERFQQEWGDVATYLPEVVFCDEQAAIVSYYNFNSLERIIEYMEFDYDAVRRDAVKLGLATEQIDWSKVESDIEDCFF